MTNIYQPAEDSYLMSSILKEQLPKLLEQNPDLNFFEMGAGSGVHLETAYNAGVKKENIFSADINLHSVQHCNLLGFNCVQSDLFEKISKEEKFDIIIFNPPYLPEDSREPEESRVSTTGGVVGNEVILRFLQQAKNHLSLQGKIFLITSNLSGDIGFKESGYLSEELGCEKLFFETLCVWELKVID